MDENALALMVCDLRKDYGKGDSLTHALNGVSFAVGKGEFVALMGASGSGKSTLLNIVATMDKKTSGEVIIDGWDIETLSVNDLSRFRRENVGFVFQDYALLDTLTGFENIALTLSINGIAGETIKSKVADMAALLHVEKILDKYPYEMSGGEKQRIAIARAMVTSPRLLLADEPTGALDSKSSQTILESFCELHEKRNASILMVSHDPYASSFADRILFLSDGKNIGELTRKDKSRKAFYEDIIDHMAEEGVQR
jgi:putative ABC transport system ATP-binding protein